MHEGYFQELAKQFSTDIPETYAGLAWRSTIASNDRDRRTVDAEASRPFALCLFADRQAAGLQLARGQAACLLCRAQHRAFRLRRRPRHGPGPQRPANDTKLRLAGLRRPDRQLAPV